MTVLIPGSSDNLGSSLSTPESHAPPTIDQRHELLQMINRRASRFLVRRGILEREEDSGYLTCERPVKITGRRFLHHK